MEDVTFLSLLLKKHFITLVLIVVYAIKLYYQKRSRDLELRYFWVTVVSCFLLVLEDVVESLAALDPDLLFFRVLFSVIGYTLRPVAVLGLLLVVCPPEKRSWKLWLLSVVNLAVNLTAFFSPIAFSFDQDYGFTRGLLGVVVFIAAFLYMAQLLVLTWRRFHEHKKEEHWILILCAVSCIAAAVLDMRFGGCRLNDALMISSIFFFMFLRSHDNRLDVLTLLENRLAFYDDLEYEQKTVTAIASLDMNGLKKINDTLGHTRGDEALVAIGRCLAAFNGRNTSAYRIGGDEFAIVFRKQTEESVKKVLAQAKENVAAAGYSVSAGYAMRAANESVEDMLQRSDRGMYQDKAAYYQQNGTDRRRR